ncbi:hypothetical protein D7X55_16835 [Corallococcus sp. AB049A]|nr:hypothetical protein D7X55_16835 [Corallococcus sp. AB049A]
MRDRLRQARERIRQWRQRRRQQQQQTPQQRLDRAVAALRPRIQSLLRRGVSRFRLRAQFAIWRAWYRLTRLYVESPGARETRIIALVNPREPLSQVYQTPGGRELFQLIHRLGEETRDWMGVQETVGDINAQRLTGGGERGSPLVLEGNQIGLGAVWDLRQYPLRQGQPQHTLLETLGAPVREQQSPFRPPGLGNVHIDFPGAGSSYADIHRGLVNLQASAGVGDREIAEVLRRLSRGERMPPWVGRTPGAAPLLGSTSRLLQLESARYSSSIIHTPMLLDLVAHPGSQRMGLQEAFASIPTVTRMDRQGRQVPVAGGGGLFPASQVGAGAGYRGMLGDLADPAPRFASGLAATRDQRRRHMEFVFRWIHSRMEAQQMDFTNRLEVERYIREMLDQQLRRSMQATYGSHAFNPHAL